LFVDKDVSKTDETLHDECHLKQRKSTIRRLMWRLVLLSDQIQSENINFISSQQTVRLLHLTEVALPLCGHSMLLCEEVCSPKTINIKQYLSTKNFLVDNIYFDLSKKMI
jgi:hypothetical protein